MIAAAFAESGHGAQQPCQKASAPLWWKDNLTIWRDCLEVLQAAISSAPMFWVLRSMTCCRSRYPSFGTEPQS